MSQEQKCKRYASKTRWRARMPHEQKEKYLAKQRARTNLARTAARAAEPAVVLARAESVLQSCVQKCVQHKRKRELEITQRAAREIVAARRNRQRAAREIVAARRNRQCGRGLSATRCRWKANRIRATLACRDIVWCRKQRHFKTRKRGNCCF